MSGFFYNLGRSVRAGVQKGKWIFQSLTGSEDDAIKAEYDAGVEIAHAFEKDARLETQGPIVQLLAEIAGALTACVRNKKRRFTVKAVRMDEPNAFALPGGFIYITRPLIQLCAGVPGLPGAGPGMTMAPPRASWSSEADRVKSSPPSIMGELSPPAVTHDIVPSESFRDELAFILGHEIGHVVRGHAMQRMVNSTIVNTATRAIPIGGALGRMAVQMGSTFLGAAYSQDHEFEADAFGLRLARTAGFDGQAAVTMMKRLQQLGGDQPENSLGSYFASHPPLEARMRELKRKLRGK